MRKTLRECLVEGGTKDKNFRLDDNRHYSVREIEGNLIPRMKVVIYSDGGGIGNPRNFFLANHLNDPEYFC